jgi:hypothetical protein
MSLKSFILHPVRYYRAARYVRLTRARLQTIAEIERLLVVFNGMIYVHDDNLAFYKHTSWKISSAYIKLAALDYKRGCLKLDMLDSILYG